jgi:serine protease Do
MRVTIPLLLAALLLPAFARAADAPPAVTGAKPANETERLRAAINDLHILGNDFWIYNNLESARAQARKENKPIFVTFRCVPCKACAGFDAEVAKGSEGIKKLAQEKFVSLRQVEMKGVDLSQFQFDYDLNWAAMFINADGTVYARYGTQSADGPDAYNSVASLEKTMARVLELHANYDKVKAALQPKRGADKPYKTGLDMPGMENKPKLAGETVRNNCIHCHMIHDAEQNQWRAEGTIGMDKLYRWPLPDNLGIHIDPKDGRRVESIVAGSPAAKGGLAAGDEITHVAGQPITSIADVQWPLHNLPNDDATFDITIDRAGQSATKSISVAKGWKKTDISWRGSRWSLRPQPGFWAPVVNDKDLKTLGDLVPAGAKPIRVQYMDGNKPQGKANVKAGLKQGDVVVALDGQPLTMTPVEFQMHVRLNMKKGDTLALKVLRNGKTIDLELPLVE